MMILKVMPLRVIPQWGTPIQDIRLTINLLICNMGHYHHGTIRMNYYCNVTSKLLQLHHLEAVALLQEMVQQKTIQT